ncbi:MAG TPA: hypothetical protein VGF84_02090, partial [Micromonosporaceae bacterium]
HRNLDRRVEALVRVTDKTAQAELEDLLDRTMSGATTAFELTADGTWIEPPSAVPEPVTPPPAPGSTPPPPPAAAPEHLQEALLRAVVG